MTSPASFDRTERVIDIFNAVVEVAPEGRKALLDQHCTADPTLRKEVLALLDAYEQTGPLDAVDRQGALPWLRTLHTSLAYEGQTISHYEVLEQLGGGGMGVVYKARDTKLDRTVALKFLPPHLSFSEAANARFIQEAKAASALDHVNICTIHEIGETNEGHLFIAMACYTGETLKAKIVRGPLPLDEALDYACQITEGLSRAHEAGIVHRDVKPANMMVTERGRVKVLDFGLAKMQDQGLTETGRPVGTVAYMSPEQAQGEAVDHRTDIWSLGVVLYEMLTGLLPFRGEEAEAILYGIRHDEPEPVRSLREEVPEALAQVVHRALAKDPHARYARCADLLADLRAYASPAPPSLLRRLRQPRFALPAFLLMVLLCFLVVRFYQARAQVQWAHSTALREVDSLIGKQQFSEAFWLARQAAQYIPEDPLLQQMLQSISVPVSVQTTPPGAEVYYRDYLSVDADWQYLGRTPFDSLQAPLRYLRWRIVKDGYEPIETAFGGWWAINFDITLHPPGTVPEGMVHVPGETFQLESADPVELPAYWIDKYEVTNRQYKAFVDAGGYQRRAYWKHPFVLQDRILSWEEAMALFRDKTGQSGPSTWELGSYPEGETDHPVAGVSWYEAAAYAEFAGKSLPTIYHWFKAVFGRSAIHSEAVILSNFKGQGSGRVGQFQGLGGFGTYDMAGNVAEWIWNQTGSRRYILGGAWNKPHYSPPAAERLLPFDRSETNGFRCVKYIAELTQTLSDPIDLASFSRDLTREKPPVSDEIFQIYKGYFSYDATALNAVVESVDESRAHWRKETVTFDAAYGDERVIVHLYLPRNAVPPYQTIIYYPTAAANGFRSSDNPTEMSIIDFVPRTGRTLVYPVYKGFHERRHRAPPGNRAFVDLMIQHVKDFSRTIDYLQTRPDIDTTRLAYMGASSGGRYGVIFSAVEPRLKASVLMWGGLWKHRLPEEVNPINFAPRVTIPVLMINGRDDLERPLETSQRPFFDLLGTLEEDKHHVLIEGGHVTPMTELIKETLPWLDRYLGPVQKKAQASEK